MACLAIEDRDDAVVPVDGNLLATDNPLGNVTCAENCGNVIFACSNGAVGEYAANVRDQPQCLAEQVCPGRCGHGTTRIVSRFIFRSHLAIG